MCSWWNHSEYPYCLCAYAEQGWICLQGRVPEDQNCLKITLLKKCPKTCILSLKHYITLLSFPCAQLLSLQDRKCSREFQNVLLLYTLLCTPEFNYLMFANPLNMSLEIHEIILIILQTSQYFNLLILHCEAHIHKLLYICFCETTRSFRMNCK